MASPHHGQRRRPPPIEIPPPYPTRPVVPGPNAFAIAERAAQAKAEERAGLNTQQPGHDDAPPSPTLPRSNSTTFRLSSKEAYVDLAGQVRKSPRKSGHSYSSSSATSRLGSTTRSRRSERSSHSAISRQRHLEGLSEETTSRGEIEAQKERKLFKMMGQVPETPKTGDAPLPDNHVGINDLRLVSRGSESDKRPDQEAVTRSPKKKIFGMSIPFSRSVNNAPTPPMPPKAARVMGATPQAKKRNFSPLANLRSAESVPRSDTSKSLPSKLFSQPGHHGRRRSPPIHEGSSRARPSHRSPTAKATVFVHEKTLEALTGSGEVERPPIPPRKDSLPDVRQKYPEIHQKIEALKASNAPRTVSQLLRPPTPEFEEEDFKDSGMKLFVPLVPKAEPVPIQGGESPSKYCPMSVADRPALVQGDTVRSAYGLVEYAIEEEDEPTHSAPLKSPAAVALPTPRIERRSAPATPLSARPKGGITRDDAARPGLRSPELEYLKPTVYSPPKTAVRTARGDSPSETDDPFLSAERPQSDSPSSRSKGGSIPVVFQGDVSEIDPQSATARSISHATSEPPLPSPRMHDGSDSHKLAARVMAELRINPASKQFAPPSPFKGALQPEQSSSQLTDILNSVSPSRADFHEFNGSSAVPSPLRRPPQSSPGRASLPGSGAPVEPGHDHPMFAGTTMPPPPRSGVPIHDHFYMTNEHIDVVAMSLYDWVQSCTNQEIKAASSKHEQLKSAVEQQFNDIKSQIDSLAQKADHNANQSHNLSVQLEKLRDFIKSEVVEPLAAQAQKTSAMEQGIKDLQKTVHDLQKSATQSPASGPSYPSPGQHFPVPNSRSRPSLPGFYDSAIPEMPPNPADSRRYNTQLGRTAYGRENRENTHTFLNTGNPYHLPGPSFSSGFGDGGYDGQFNNYSQMHGPSYYNQTSK